jgi:Carotenoid biosynthesis protein
VTPGTEFSIGTASTGHFRLAAGLFAVAAAVELGAEAVHGVAGAGPRGWLALLAAGSWVVGLVWRERVGIFRAWQCAVWVTLGSLVLMLLAVRHGFLFGRLEFAGGSPALGPVPLSVPLLWWLVVGGGFLVVEGLWGESRAGVSGFTALIAVQLALMLLPFLGRLRGYWRWPAGAGFLGVSWDVLVAWLILSLGLALGLVIMGENWSSAEARTGRQAWAPAAVLLTLTLVCLTASLQARLWLAATFAAANAVVFTSVLVRCLRPPADRGAAVRGPG